ncbi:nitrous oxide reductase accessory protein NosL [Flagellimonas myxillae]|uniref:nitrous oxide reductase accessory protein NosL n=1 Tax=Flagellimonas myxillae TaxID=2942214 RepID=UPI00201F1EAB|nr:nitrous oxide reductase accessory protein NosL [Muricauda myxillae]MCL6267893.1 nitrous oxide reductase accessory protein NosL [Muricauda myxillae]
MIKQNILLAVLFSLGFFFATGQNTERCSACGMDIRQNQFKARAEKTNGKMDHFDSVECLVQQVQSKASQTFVALAVTDFKTEEEIDATKAYYLRSEKVSSPMGANLSAYATRKSAQESRKVNGGDIMDWDALNNYFTSSSFGVTEHVHHNHGPSSYAPSGVMGDHLHPKGGVMISLRSMYMSMQGNRNGSSKVQDSEIYQNFMVAPQQMGMEMFMLGLMYAPSERVTLMLMQNMVSKDMDLSARMMMDNGMSMINDFSTSSSGLGDLKLGMLYGVFSNGKNSLHLNTKVSLPIGKIDSRDATPMMADAKLPYAMQLGSGTFDWTLGATFKQNFSHFTLGIQQLNTFSTGRNSDGYRLGNISELHTWLGYNFSNIIGVNARLSGSTQGAISGMDTDLNPMMVPTANPNNYGGELVSGGLGTNILIAKGKLILGVEFNAPLYQNYNGIFMNSDYSIHAGIRYNVL